MALQDYLPQAKIITQGRWADIYRTNHGNDSLILKIRANQRLDYLKDLELFEREIEVMSELNHPQIPKILENGEEGGIRYFVMQDVGEKNLYQYTNKKPISDENAVRIITALTAPVNYIHQLPLPIIHRDINPSNVVVNGQTYLIDFGILNEAIEKTLGGNTTIGYGTIGYTAMEVFQGYARPGSDIFSIGRVLFFMLTGHDPKEEIGVRGKIDLSKINNSQLKELIDKMTEPFVSPK